MATIGQVVYNLQDFHSSGGLISTSAKNLSSTVTSESSGYAADRLNIFTNDLVKLFNASSFLKLGIQAPPGTKVKLNSNKLIMIGRTGVYELDEDIKVTGLQFERPKKYVVDTAATKQSLDEGINGFEKAESDRTAALTALNNKYAGKDKDEAYWAEYTRIQDDYVDAYKQAQSKYIAGINGIYVLPNTSDPNADENFEELYNVIVDFLY